MARTAAIPEFHLHIPAEWIDYNGHLNVGYYAVAFDRATDALLDHLDLGVGYRRRTNHSVFILEAHVTFQREVSENDVVRFATRVLDADGKRLHVFHAMYHRDDGWLSATAELLALHVSMEARRSAPIPESHRAAIDDLAALSSAQAWPEQCGRVIGIRRPAGVA